MMTKPIKNDARLTSADRQLRPLAGETSPEDARRMALHFAVVEKLRLEAARNGSGGATAKTKTTPK
jgi:hypothetical protein